MRLFFTLIIFSTLMACGSNTKDRVVAVKIGDDYYKPESSAAMALDTKSDERIVCKKRIVTGSHRKERTCVTQAQLDSERKAAQENMTNNQMLLQRRELELKNADPDFN